MGSKIRDFFIKAAGDGATKNEIITILGDKKLADATDEQFSQICEVAKKLGVDITAEEIKAFANGSMVLDDSELESVAGGWDEQGRPTQASEWYSLARQIEEAAAQHDSGTARLEMAKKIAAEHNLSLEEVAENWKFFMQTFGIYYIYHDPIFDS